MASYIRSQSRRERPLPRTGSSRGSSFADRRRREEMPQALLLRAQVADVRGRGADLEGDAFRHANAVRAELLDLRGVVRHQLDRGDPEDPQHACGTFVTSEVRRKTKRAVRIDRVETVILKVVRRNLVDDADAPSFLGEVQEDAFGRPPESLQCGIQLLAAVAPLRTEYIAGHAFELRAAGTSRLPANLPFPEATGLSPGKGEANGRMA